MQNFIVAVIVVAAVVYLARRFYNSTKSAQNNTCGCGCGGCDQATSCEQIPGSEKEPDSPFKQVR